MRALIDLRAGRTAAAASAAVTTNVTAPKLRARARAQITETRLVRKVFNVTSESTSQIFPDDRRDGEGRRERGFS